jgi:hypothetical protein
MNKIYKSKSMLIALCAFNFAHCQTNNNSTCNAEGILIPKQKSISLLQSPNGKVLGSIMNDTLNDNYYTLTINDFREGCFFVKAASVLDSNKTGWIRKEYVGVYTRNYNSNLDFYEKPNKSSKVMFTSHEYNPEPWEVIECSGPWLKVRNVQRTIEGWLEPSMQCANPYTTCN